MPEFWGGNGPGHNLAGKKLIIDISGRRAHCKYIIYILISFDILRAINAVYVDALNT